MFEKGGKTRESFLLNENAARLEKKKKKWIKGFKNARQQHQTSLVVIYPYEEDDERGPLCAEIPAASIESSSYDTDRTEFCAGN